MSRSHPRTPAAGCPDLSTLLDQIRWDNQRQLDKALPAPLLRWLDGTIRRMLRRSGCSLNSDIVDDCRQAAALLLWKRREKIKAVPQAEREAYAAASIFRTIRPLLRRECRHKARTLSFQDLTTAYGQPVEFRDETSVGWEDACVNDLLHQVSRSDLAHALRTLPQRDYAILNFFYAKGLTDPQIAQHLGLLPATVRQQRHRAMRKIRKGISVGQGWASVC
jgi:RNA polymerase sigma factor (sigma-70 family)